MDLLKIAEAAFAREKKEFPAFKSGDTITVAYRIAEGNKERIQQYRGVVIKIAGHGDAKRFTVRKMSDNIGVERIFPMNSPFIENITLNSAGKVRRTKLYYLRNLRGKAARIKRNCIKQYCKRDKKASVFIPELFCCSYQTYVTPCCCCLSSSFYLFLC